MVAEPKSGSPMTGTGMRVTLPPKDRLFFLRLQRREVLFVPTQISWRRAQQFVGRGWATLYPFHERWLGRLDVTPLGRSVIS